MGGVADIEYCADMGFTFLNSHRIALGNYNLGCTIFIEHDIRVISSRSAAFFESGNMFEIAHIKRATQTIINH